MIMMTKIRLLVSRAGVGFAQDAGSVVTVDPAEAARLIAAGQAVPADTIETAVVEPVVERAVKPQPRKRRQPAKKKPANE